MAEGCDGLGGVGTEGVAGVKIADGRVVERHPEARDAGLGCGIAGGQFDERLIEEGFVAEHAFVPFDVRGEAAAGKNLHIFGGFPGETEIAGGIDDGVGERMVGALLGGGGDAEEIVLLVAGEGMNCGEHGAANGEGAGFVENDDVEMRKTLERFAALEEDAELRAAAYGNGKRGGHGEAHGAGAGDDEHGNGVCEGQLERVRGEEPGDEGDEGEAKDYRDEDGAGAIGEALHGRARTLRLFYHPRDLRQDCGFAEGLRAASDGSVVVERACQDAAARLAGERRGFAGEHGFIDGGAAFDDGCVDREALAGKNEDVVAGLNLFKRHHSLHAIDDAAGGDGAEAGERVEGGQGASFGAGFKAFAQSRKPTMSRTASKYTLRPGAGQTVA